jgi:hypothetical protein
MNQVSSGIASNANEQVNAPQKIRRLHLDRYIGVGAAILILAGGFTLTSSAFAQATQDTATCAANCKAEVPKCKDAGSSEELCDYDSKQCEKACSQSK